MFPTVIDDLSAEFIELGDEILLRIELLIRIVGLWDVGVNFRVNVEIRFNMRAILK